MPRPSGKATISLKGNARNLPDIYFRELVQLYSRDCRTRGIQVSHMAYQEHFKAAPVFKASQAADGAAERAAHPVHLHMPLHRHIPARRRGRP